MKINWFKVLVSLLALVFSIVFWAVVIKFWIVIPVLIIIFIVIIKKEKKRWIKYISQDIKIQTQIQ